VKRNLVHGKVLLYLTFLYVLPVQRGLGNTLIEKEKKLLTVEMIPPSSWGDNLRNKLGPEKWSRLSKIIYNRAGRRCEICNGIGERHPVECHEVWEYHDELGVQKLIDLIALCPQCHKVKHIGRSKATGTYDDSLYHLMVVNNWGKSRAIKHIALAVRECLRRGRWEWIIDTSKVDEILENKK